MRGSASSRQPAPCATRRASVRLPASHGRRVSGA
jgi:hypothetical protein